jgi:GDP-4-dehydro-6-deoxy-D-mannose reductase
MRVLITGANGFAGSFLASHLLENNDEVFATDLQAGSYKNCSNTELDISDISACGTVIKQVMPDAVIHLAGLAFAPDSERNFSLALNINVGGTYNILRACAESKNPVRVVVVSSSEVYGPPQKLPLTEEHELHCANNYGLTKAMCEQLVRRFVDGPLPQSRMQPIIIRAFNHIGPRQRPDFVVPSFACQLAEIALGKREPVMKVGNLEAKRDFSDVRDIVRGYRLAALGGCGPINLCSGKSHSIQRLLDTLIEIAGVKVNIEQDPSRMRPSEVPDLFGSYQRAKAELNWEPRYDFRQSLEDIYNYWYSKVKNKG